MIKIKLLEGKTKSERNKMIAAGILGVVSLLALYMAFGRSSSSSATTVRVTATPRPGTPAATRTDAILPTMDEQNFLYETTPVAYVPGNAYAPDAGRNIFAFYEPPPPCNPSVPGDCPPPPTPKPATPLPPATPAPTPPIIIAYVNPQAVYAGTREPFRLEVNGERMTPDAKIYFNQQELPTQYINPVQLVAQVPGSRVTQEGQAQIIVQTADGKTFSNQFLLTVQAPPKPSLQYIGMIGRKRYNNDTAYFTETNKPTPYGARLNDVIGGRFRLVDISPVEVVFEDTTLGFRHRIAITKTVGAPAGAPGPGRLQPEGFQPYNPGAVNEIPGFPNNIPRYVQPPQPQKPTPRKPNNKDDVDDDGDGR